MKKLAFLLLVSCCVSAFCLALLAYTLTTGEIPFNLESVVDRQMANINESDEGKTEDTIKAELEEEKTKRLRQGEDFAVKLYDDLQNERQKLSLLESELKDRENRVVALEQNVKHLQGLVDKSKNDISKLLKTLDEKEIENLKNLASLVGEVEIKSGAKMLFDMDKEIATRVLYYMNPKQAAEVVSAMVADNDPKKSLIAVELAESMRTFTPEISMNEKN